MRRLSAARRVVIAGSHVASPHFRCRALATLSSDAIETRLRHYDPHLVEARWRPEWAKNRAMRRQDASEKKDKFYCLSMFPYPSGTLHMGHVRVYTICDAAARFKRMQGKDVLCPMGWDAFGLPAENAAIDRGLDPESWTKDNIKAMKRQLEMLGTDFDWEETELATCDPSYYKWTQSLFLRLMRAGLAYRAESSVNWDPVDQTVLANEQVDSQGRSWRSGAVVEKRRMNQWFFKITAFADELLQGLEGLDKWPSSVRALQENWIGRSEGAFVDFDVQVKGGAAMLEHQKLRVFTTRLDTLFGVSFLALAPSHPLVQYEAARDVTLLSVVKECERAQRHDHTKVRTHSDGRPSGARLAGLTAVHPLTGEKIPVFVAAYVLGDYGSGAVMGVPAHDERDFAFASEHALPVRPVIAHSNGSVATDRVYTDSGHDGILVNSQRYSGLPSGSGANNAIDRIAADLATSASGGKTVDFRLRDWLVSRQRYWGAPIPVVHCETCGAVPVPDEQLPVTLPPASSFSRGSSLSTIDPDWVKTPCPKCGSEACRDTDTMDTFVDSSWYFMRYPDARNDAALASPAKAKHWLAVDLYIGGVEHAILHLLYARFITRFLYKEGLAPTPEPFTQLLTQGMVQGRTYRDSEGNIISSNMVQIGEDGVARHLVTGDSLESAFEKMSKSKFNGVDPIPVIQEFGADTVRLFTLFKAPPPLALEWEVRDIQGQHRWLKRVWSLANLVRRTQGKFTGDTTAIRRSTHAAIKVVTEALDGSYAFNVAIAELMKLSNTLAKASDDGADGNCREFVEGVETLLTMMAPFAPHIASELWDLTIRSVDRNRGAVLDQQWPEFDPSALVFTRMTRSLMIGGKVRGLIEVSVDATVEDIEIATRASFAFEQWTSGRRVKRIVIPPRANVVNIVLE